MVGCRVLVKIALLRNGGFGSDVNVSGVGNLYSEAGRS